MQTEESRAKYDEWHQANADHRGADSFSDPWHQMVIPRLGELGGKKILEIGCGRGGFTRFLAEQGATSVVGADFSPVAVEHARGLLKDFPQCELRVEDIQSISFPDATFDLTLSLETLEHVPDPDRGLAELVRVTKPGGRLLITTPNYFGGQGLYRWYRDRIGRPFTEVGQPINNPLTLRERVQKLQKLGCRVDEVDGVGHYLYLPGRSPMRLAFLDNPRRLMRWLCAHSFTGATKL